MLTTRKHSPKLLGRLLFFHHVCITYFKNGNREVEGYSENNYNQGLYMKEQVSEINQAFEHNRAWTMHLCRLNMGFLKAHIMKLQRRY